MEVGRLPISASQRGKLISAGYTTLASLSSLSSSDLARGNLLSAVEFFLFDSWVCVKLTAYGRARQMFDVISL